MGTEDIAIVGMACRFPDADNYHDFWNNLINEVDSVREVPEERWNTEEYTKLVGDSIGYASKKSGLLKNIDMFDNHFFNISPREAKMMDPQQRLLLEESWHCIEDSGIPLKKLQNDVTSVYVGAMSIDYYQNVITSSDAMDGYAGFGVFNCLFPNRISYLFDFKGISKCIDTACSSVLVALHEARQELIWGRSDYCMVAGVNLNINPARNVMWVRNRMLSPDGKCKTFDMKANGFVSGEGIGVILLQPLTKALQDKNRILGILKGSAVNHCGKSNSLTAPKVEAQRNLLLQAYEEAGVDPGTVTYVEAHGTGTSLGDPIEIEALTQAFRKYTDKKRYCKIGSVKTNLGHLEGAAAIPGIIKTVLMLNKKKIPRSLHANNINPIIDIDNTPFEVAVSSSEWTGISESEPLRAGVSAFGYGGTNGHAVLQEYLPDIKEDSHIIEDKYIFCLSAKSEKSLKNLLEDWKGFIFSTEFESMSLNDICGTLLLGREHFKYRCGCVVSNKEEISKFIASAGSEDIVCDKVDKFILRIGDKLPAENLIKDNYYIRKYNECLKNIEEQGGSRHLWKDCKDYEDNKEVDRELLQVISTYIVSSMLIEAGVVPSLIYGEQTGIFAALAVAGILPLEEVLLLFKENVGENISVKRPQIPLYNLITGEIIERYRINDAYLASLTKSLEIEDAYLYYAGKAKVLYENQITFQRLINEWNIIAKEYGYDILKILEDGNTFDFSDLNYEKKVLVTVCCMDSLKKLNQKWELSDHIKFKDDRLYELLDLLEDEVLHRDEFVQLLFGMTDTKEILGIIKGRCHLLKSDKPYKVLNGYNKKLEEITDIGKWLKEIKSCKSEINFKEGQYIDIGSLADDTEQGDIKDLLLELWMSGADLAWEKIYGEKYFNNVGLPLYSFDRQKYWVDKKQYYDSKSEVLTPLYYKKMWKESKPESFLGLANPQCLFIFAAEDTISSEIAQIYEDSRVVYINLGKERKVSDSDKYQINQNDESDFKWIISLLQQSGNKPDVILYLSEMDINNSLEHSNRDFNGVSSLMKTLIFEKLADKARIFHIYQGNKNNSNPFGMSIAGLLRVSMLEHPVLSCRSIGCADLNDAKGLAGMVSAEINIPSKVPIEVLWENQKRYTGNYENFNLDTCATDSVKVIENGVYLITGGAGGLGLIFATYLAHKAKVQIVLTGRSELNSDRKKELDKIKESGSNVCYMKSDITKQSEVFDLVTHIKSEFGSIHGIIHAAGIYKSNYMIHNTQKDSSSVTAPKIEGTIYLDQALKDEKLDFFVFFSSVSAVLGDIGLSYYAYANSFLDNYAKYRGMLCRDGKRSGKTVVFNWPLWMDAGMRISEAENKRFTERTGVFSLSVDQGLRFFEDIVFNYKISSCMPCYGKKDIIESLFAEIDCSMDREETDKISEMREDTSSLINAVTKFLAGIIAEETGVNEKDILSDTEFSEYGVDSIIVNQFNAKMSAVIKDMSQTLLFEYRNIRELTDYFINNHKREFQNYLKVQENGTKKHVITALKKNSDKADTNQLLKQETCCNNENMSRKCQENIAIIGIAGQYPGAKNINEFWKNLITGKDCITEIPAERWDYRKYFNEDIYRSDEGKMYSKWGGFVDNADKFDPLFFHISPREASGMDPQERCMLQTAWSVFENAGYTRKVLKNTKVGVFVGATLDTYRLNAQDEWNKGNFFVPNTCSWSIANRISYYFDLNGPSMPVDTACSSSLSAVHIACNSIKNGECTMALAGGINLIMHPSEYVLRCQMRMLSPTGKCHSFGADADGFVPGEGHGAVLLKPLSAAERDNDYIYAVIKGSSINHGGKTNGYTVPNPNAQSELINKALEEAHIDPRTITYVEAHGTGTKLGDPIEISGLSKAYRKYTQDNQYCGIGSVKTNVGHLESAAGIAGLTKLILQMQHRQLTPSLNAEKLNPAINFKQSPFYVQKESKEWDRPEVFINGIKEIFPRRAALSAFGAGGSNAHLILEEYITNPAVITEQNYSHVIVLSAKDKERLNIYAESILDYLEQVDTSHICIADIAYTLQNRRESMEERISFVVSDMPQMKERLKSFCSGEVDSENFYFGNISQDNPFDNELFANDEGKNFINSLISKGMYKKLSYLWVKGVNIDWMLFYGNDRPNIISLPTYPFKQEKCWLYTKEENIPANSHSINDVPKIHPLLFKNNSTFKAQKYSACFSGKEFYLNDHIVEEQKVLPGAAYIEMIRAAAENAAGISKPVIRDIIWAKPVIVNDNNVEVEVELFYSESGIDYEVRSRDSETNNTNLHSYGFVELEESNYDSRRLNPQEVIARCPHIIEQNECYESLKSQRLDYGKSFRTISKLYCGSNESLSILRLPEGLDIQSQFVLHPSLLDGAFQTVNELNRQQDGEKNILYLPYSLGKVQFNRPIPQRCFAHAQAINKVELNENGIRTYNIYIYDDTGEFIAGFEEFSVKMVRSDYHGEMLQIFRNLKDNHISLDEAEYLLEELNGE